MSNPAKALSVIRALEENAARQSPVHDRHPLAHLCVTVCLLIVATSYSKYAVAPMLPLVLYPLAVMALGQVPARDIALRTLPALPLILGVGILNPLLDSHTVVLFGRTVSAGWLSLISLAVRGSLCVVASLLLVSLCGMAGIAQSLRALHVPQIIVAQLVMTFRYLETLTQEAGRILLAHQLRAPGRRNVSLKHWAPMVGQWLLRSIRRADRVYQAMRCRGFRGTFPSAGVRRMVVADALYTFAWCGFFLAARLTNLPVALGDLLLRLGG